MDSKIVLGQFFTETNPFGHSAVMEWTSQFDGTSKVLEPYAGANNIVRMMRDLKYNYDWTSYDIDPKSSDVLQRDTIVNFPIGFPVIITNPPYLAKNSASRRKLNCFMGEYDDLYKYCISQCLEYSGYVAAIIPESFITANIFHTRLFSWISLPYRMFWDTECPVGLALWVPNKQNDFRIYSGEKYVGMYNELKQYRYTATNSLRVQFNNVSGSIGLIAVDGNISGSIRFCTPEEINSEIKHSSRALTKLSIQNSEFSENELIQQSNILLEEYRAKTNDVFLTSFKGLRKDGQYRRRLDFDTAKHILNTAYHNLRVSGSGFFTI